MPKQTISLGVGSYERPDLPMAAQRCVNLYAAPAQASGISRFSLRGTPGIVSFSSLGSGKSRGAIVMDGVYYVVSGTSLYSLDRLGNSTNRGTIAGTVRVSMAHNGEKLCIVVPGGNGYVYNATTTTLAQIVDPDYRTSDMVVFKDGYYVFTETGSNVFFNSALNDPLTFAALDFGTAEQSPGDIVAAHANFDEVVILKEDNAEIFRNVGGSGFPFQRIPGASLEKGCHSKYSPIQWEDSLYFLGGGIREKTAFYRMSQATPVMISTDAITNEIQKFTRDEISRSFSFSYSIGGYSFVGFTIRSVNIASRTFVYNITGSAALKRPIWFEQQSGVPENAWRIESLDFAYDKLLVSDYADGSIGYLDAGIYTEYGDTIRREKTTPPVYNVGNSFYMAELEAVLRPGQGVISGQGSDPKIMMKFSDDGGFLWSNEFWRTMGKIGEYEKRAVWRRLGRIPSYRIFSFAVSDPVDMGMLDLSARMVA